MNGNNKLSIISILGLVLALVLGGVAIATALRMSSQPSVSPTVPQSKPQASEITVTPACALSFKVAYIPSLKCDSVMMIPGDPAIVGGSETRRLTATASGGITPLSYSWVSTGGSLSATTGQFVTWTSPGSITSSDSWKITATVKDSSGKTDSSGCVVNLAANPPPSKLPALVCNSDCTDSSQCPSSMACSNGKCRNPSCVVQADCVCPPPPVVMPPPAPTTQTHRECRNYACVVVNGSGENTCNSDVTCKPAAVAPKIPESGVSLPTILGIVGGFGLLLLGILVAI